MSNFIPIEFQKAFDKTRKQAFEIQATYSTDSNRLSSQFGGYPYWEGGVEIPMDSDNSPMALLAQINFAEVPSHPDVPQQGILQIFIPKNDDAYGVDFDNPSAQPVVAQFWTSPDESKLGDWSENLTDDDLTPVNGKHVLAFVAKDEVAGIDTIECAEAMKANPFEVLEDVALNEKEEAQFFDNITEYTASYGHKLLGYPYFTQEEPRSTSDYRLLLQIDTDMDGDNDIMWGDNGVGHVFIRDEDLRHQKFDNMWLYWDCC